MAPGSLVIGLAVFSSCYLAHSSVVGRYEYRNPAILCCSSACRWSLEIYPCRYHPAKSKETCLYSGPGVLSTLCRYVSCPSATVYCCNVFLSVMKKNAKKAVKPFACGSLGHSALRIADIRSSRSYGSSWPTPADPSSSRKPPMEKMAARRGSGVWEISPSGSFLISWPAELDPLLPVEHHPASAKVIPRSEQFLPAKKAPRRRWRSRTGGHPPARGTHADTSWKRATWR